MIEISLGKLVLLALIALIVLGPEKLPGAARTAGALLRRVRSGWDNVRAEVERELEVEQIRRAAREAAAHAETVQSELKHDLQQVSEPLVRLGATADSRVTASPPQGLQGGKPAPIEVAEAGAQAELPLGQPAATPGTSSHDHL